MNKLQFNRMATTVLFAVLVFVSSVALAQKPIKRPPKKVRQTTTQQVAKPPKKTVAPAKPTKGKINGHEWVDLGLSVKWATMNVGADSPSDYGDYFAWGETEPKSEFTEENCKTMGLDLPDISGNSEYDAARANWGGNWRIPTLKEWQELYNCKFEWTSIDGINGVKFTGYNGNYIFLCVNIESDKCRYWSSNNSSGFFAEGFTIDRKLLESGFSARRFVGLPVRPVTK